jgi:predicted RecA/RadA family phage recombinase
MADVATARDSLRNLRTLKHTHSAALTPGKVLVANGQVLVAVNTTAASVENVFIYRGRVEMDKAAVAVAAGEAAYWDDTAKNVTNVVGTNTKCGIFLEAAVAGASTAVLMLHEN